ncbi:cytochrome P450 1A1-like [Babylonia areolata]|uniref:cytochrome P450 1A1-like n=1 Tax=Babylonia areolata TaxID=304850 RepID=UPI003FCF8FAD
MAISLDLPLGDIKAIVAVFVVTLVAMKMITTMKKKRYNLPPGPWGLPLVGYLPFFGPMPHVTFTEMRKKYGDVVSITMGSWPAVVISGCDAIKEALVTKRDDFAGRPAFTTSVLLNDGRNFGFGAYGPVNRMQRKIVSNVVYTFSNARKNPIEDIIRSDAKIIVEEFLSHGGKSFCPLEQLSVAASSMVYQLCYGRLRNIREDEDFLETVRQTNNFSEFTKAGNPVDVMPWLRYVMPSKISKFLELLKMSVDVRSKKVEEHESSFHESDLRDIADGLIHAGNNLSKEEKALGLDKNRVVENLDTVFGAGTSTVSSNLKWFVGLMATFPEVQEEVFQQINDVVGQDRDITLADRTQLPLLEATLYEILRFIGTVPFAIPHSTTCDTTLQGYDIPEGTVVLVNLYSAFMDEKVWGDPKIFRPQRFLDSEGQLDRGLVEQVPAFSLGRRRCVGEVLARMELFLFTGTLIQRLKFFKPPEQPDFELKQNFGLTLEVQPYNVCVIKRE